MPCYIKHPKRDHNFDNHPYGDSSDLLSRAYSTGLLFRVEGLSPSQGFSVRALGFWVDRAEHLQTVCLVRGRSAAGGLRSNQGFRSLGGRMHVPCRS